MNSSISCKSKPEMFFLLVDCQFISVEKSHYFVTNTLIDSVEGWNVFADFTHPRAGITNLET